MMMMICDDYDVDKYISTSPFLLQALEAANIELSSNGGSSGPIHWNQSNAINYLMSHQAPDGSFGDVFTTTEVILALGPRHLNSIRDLNCGGSNTAVTVTASSKCSTPR